MHRRGCLAPLLCLALALITSPSRALARPNVPTPGPQPPHAVQQELATNAARLDAELTQLAPGLSPSHRALLPDIQVLHRAVVTSLVHGEFQHTNDPALARNLLALAFTRAAELRAGRPTWPLATGLVVRGYLSRVDGSVQPYGVVVPPTWQPGGRLDVWLHGRDERLTELRFLGERLRSPGEFTPPDTLVVHPYGRFCNAFKFAGETDVREALDHAIAAYGADTNRLGIRGFSMGGGGTWHLAAHHPGLWRAAAPGAGFAETAEYTGILKQTPLPPPWEQRLWRWYDATEYAANFRQLPLLAYSGERDRQIQAARVMERALATEGLTLQHLIGPGVEHRYEPQTKRELATRFDALMDGPAPILDRLDLTTHTLRYPQGEGRVWARLEGLGTHWERARLRAQRSAPDRVEIQTENVTAFALLPGAFPTGHGQAVVDGQPLPVSPGATAHHFTRRSGRWIPTSRAPSTGKRPGLQGPIDDAFLDAFLVVTPTGKSRSPAVDAWVQQGWRQFTNDWRAQFRGEVRIKPDTAVTPADLAAYHVVVWGDPDSNRLLGRMTGKLPLNWDRRSVRLGRERWSSTHHVPSFIAPNPLNPDRYVVVNSGHTFATWTGTNARQTPFLPDWAVWELGADTPPRVLQAGWFGEDWK